MNTYTVVDTLTDEVVAEEWSLDDLRIFANDLFWMDETVDFEFATYKETENALVGCGYEIVCENIGF